ncbi:MAG: amphi-Trp domain-containing protein [Desulfovibrio sp.]|nr:amphi-Trp domain-containing protein [Desulfovibrio sp.]
MGKNNKVKIDGAMELGQVITYLEDVVKGLKAGTVHVQLGQDSVLLHPSSILSFEMEVSQKKDKEKFSFEMSWKTEDRASEDVRISTSAPTVEIS